MYVYSITGAFMALVEVSFTNYQSVHVEIRGLLLFININYHFIKDGLLIFGPGLHGYGRISPWYADY